MPTNNRLKNVRELLIRLFPNAITNIQGDPPRILNEIVSNIPWILIR